ncbi:unnamed protein product [Medioppia subpectinata]|uniref:UDP-D-xylose:beta-D-glucoside alpha-1,3-D-xylosyltransferase n=1 Tax=Medioppia subpectinata TaxID=1979941 RepID=A0A7R9KNY1_9ACAR|nr:unnamed protein product [Medioppia subpectinata]CAG2107088.1 unnamed protein product [Medioppia subpectinata]
MHSTGMGRVINRIFTFGAKPTDHMMKIAVTSCGDHHILEQTLNRRLYMERLLEWPANILARISFEIHQATFPNVSNPEYFRKAFKPCASQRLFYPILLPNYDSVIHIDSDSIFLQPVNELWQHFQRMNGSESVAMAPDNTNPNTSWYKNYNTGRHRIPTPTLYSLNTGVILMNLTRMRETDFFGHLEPIIGTYGSRINWFVNDFMSIYLHQFPDRYLNVSCRWNFLTDHCDEGLALCPAAHRLGVGLLHGSRHTFMSWSRAPAFRAVYLAFLDYQFNTDLRLNLVLPLKRN